MLTCLSCYLVVHYARKYSLTWLIPVKRLKLMADAAQPQ